MVKVHTRTKRKYKVAHNKRGVQIFKKRKKRLKTFKSEELAKKWAEANKIKDYELVNLKNLESKTKKIRVIPKKI